MILQCSHLVLSSDNFAENAGDLQQLGYTPIFTESGVFNPPLKRPLFTHFNNHHDVSYFTAPNNISIELLNWGTGNHCHSNFTCLFEELPENKVSLTSTLTIDTTVLHQGTLHSLNLPIYVSTRGSNSSPSLSKKCSLNAIVARTNNLMESIRFWKLFRFSIVSENSSSALLELIPVLPRSPRFYLYVVGTETINIPPNLDDKGVSCLSFLSNNISREREILHQHGWHTFDVGKLSINNKILNILFVRGRTGELVEVIDMKENQEVAKKTR